MLIYIHKELCLVFLCPSNITIQNNVEYVGFLKLIYHKKSFDLQPSHSVIEIISHKHLWF